MVLEYKNVTQEGKILQYLKKLTGNIGVHHSVEQKYNLVFILELVEIFCLLKFACLFFSILFIGIWESHIY